jgi:hypothetical protein
MDSRCACDALWFDCFINWRLHLQDFKRQIVELLKSFETSDRKPLATINPNNYIQHNLRVADGLAGFRERLEALPKGAAKVNTVRIFQMATSFLPIPNTTSAAPRWVSIFSDLKTERLWSTGTTSSRPPPSGVRAATP